MALNESVEDYLEAILVIGKRMPAVKSVDIADELGFQKSSISIALKNLKEKGLVEVREHGYIYLTDEGRQIAEFVYEKHTLLTKWLVSLGVPEDIASVDACRIEHDISDVTFEAIKAHTNR